eukprot:SAG11_NODE_21906_length_416_cov_0.958991_1_plen_51_part_01
MVENGGELTSRKGLNVPDLQLPLVALTAKDRADAAHLLTQDLEYICMSFVQ